MRYKDEDDQSKHVQTQPLEKEGEEDYHQGGPMMTKMKGRTPAQRVAFGSSIHSTNPRAIKDVPSSPERRSQRATDYDAAARSIANCKNEIFNKKTSIG